MNLFAGMELINTNIKIKVELKTTLKNREKEYIMMSAEEVRIIGCAIYLVIDL